MEYQTKVRFESKVVPGVSVVLRKMSHGRRMELNAAISPILAKIENLNRKTNPIREEIDRAQEAAKIEPCGCLHPKGEEQEKIVASRLEEANAILPKGTAKIGIVDVCHSSTNKRCLIDGCKCREPQTDEAIGGLPELFAIMDEMESIRKAEVMPAYLRWAIAKIQGLKLGDEEGELQDATVDTLISDGPEVLTQEFYQEIQRMVKLGPEETLGFPLRTTSGAVVDAVAQSPNTDPSIAPPAENVADTNSDTAASISPI